VIVGVTATDRPNGPCSSRSRDRACSSWTGIGRTADTAFNPTADTVDLSAGGVR
jgi:hypothetical protein